MKIDQWIANIVAELISELGNSGDQLKTVGGSTSQEVLDRKGLARLIDHTLLKPEATPEDITQLCREALKYEFASVCVNPCFVELCKKLLQGSKVLTCTVVGFPLGANIPEVKAGEARAAAERGADEIDMVMNVGMLKSKAHGYVMEDIRGVVEACGKGTRVKVILETCLLTDEEKIKACILAKMAGAHFVKTSTGFGKVGATVKDVELMRKVVGSEMGVKAAGGIRNFQTAVQMVQAGANRIGTSSGVAIMEG